MPTGSETAANTLAESLRREILTRRLGEGDLFMTEEEICDRYGISRTIAREAVSQLRGLGILRSRQGKGLLVGRPDSVHLFSKTLPFAGYESDAVRQLMEMRYTLEMGAIEQAVESASDEQCGRLVRLAEEFDAAVEAGDLDENSRVELEFHGLILRMTGNPLIAGMHAVIFEYFRAADPIYDPPPTEHLRETSWEHRAIARAVADHDGELARVLLRKHLRHVKSGKRA